MLPSHREVVPVLIGHVLHVLSRALGGVLGWPGPPVLQAHHEPPVLRAVLGIVLCVGHVLPPSPKQMEIFLFSKISFQMCRNFLSVRILENLVLIVKPNANFFQTLFLEFLTQSRQQISSISLHRAALRITLLRG